MLAEQKKRIDSKESFETFFTLCRRITVLKKEYEWLGETPIGPLRTTAKSLTNSLKEWRAKKLRGMPRFKKKGRCPISLGFPAPFKIEGDRAKLPRIGWVRFRKSREIIGKVRTGTVTRKGKHWFISIQTEQDVKDPIHPSTSAIGIDLGIAKFATLSTGEAFESLNSFRTLELKLARLQKNLSRKKKLSSNWKKQKEKISKLHIRIANARQDYLHKISEGLSKEHSLIAIEDLKVKNMSKSAKGTSEDPGKNVKAKSGLNKSILDQGWFDFRRQLEYKSEWFGGEVVAINPKNTSRRCNHCGYTAKENRRTQAGFVCLSCGEEANADENAAKNILELAMESVAALK